jgi:hypothetical protein
MKSIVDLGGSGCGLSATRVIVTARRKGLWVQRCKVNVRLLHVISVSRAEWRERTRSPRSLDVRHPAVAG